MQQRILGTWTAVLLVIASMVGTGAFTTSGILLQNIHSPWATLWTWLIGGLIALFGAFSYAELVSAFPQNGGEYQLLSRIFHPAVGFVAGWISLVVGFSAPIAAASIAFGSYLHVVLPWISPLWAGSLLIALLSMVHGIELQWGSHLQNLFTLAKVSLILLFISAAIWERDALYLHPFTFNEVWNDLISPGFAVGLIFVSFAYSGWNGAAYLAGEIKNPSRNLPLALGLGTALVALLYIGLNAVFLFSAPLDSLIGKVEIGHVASIHLFGEVAGEWLSAGIALLLISSVSAMIMTGPRVYQTMGKDYPSLKFLSVQTRGQGPIAAVSLQASVALIMLWTSSFDALLTYIGFTLSLSAGLTVYGVFHLRRKEPLLERPFKVWGYPWTPALFIALSAWMIIYTLIERPWVSLAGIATLAMGWGHYLWLHRCSHSTHRWSSIKTQEQRNTLP